MYVFFYNDTATTEIYTLSLHDALPIFAAGGGRVLRGSVHAGDHAVERRRGGGDQGRRDVGAAAQEGPHRRSEEHTSEIQSRPYLVWRLLFEKKKKQLPQNFS